MQPNRPVESKEELQNHFGSSQKLEILNKEQMEDLLQTDVPTDVWEEAYKKNLLSFSKEFVKRTVYFASDNSDLEHIYLISFLTNQTELHLNENIISDISAISKLKNLKKLELQGNSIKDISALQSLTDLTHFNLQRNKLTSYTLALPNLVDLSLGNNKLIDKSGLQYSPKLESLNLSETETTDLRSIPHQLFGLKQLDLSENNLTKISYLSNFVDLQYLALSCLNQLTSIEPLEFCTKLTELRIQETNISDIWPVQFMKNLKQLIMNDTKVVDLHPLQHLHKLEIIYAYSARIIDVFPLSNLTQLKTLLINNNRITNGETLKHHKNFSKYKLQDQKVPTVNEQMFYNRIFFVHSSQKIQNENKISKLRALFASKKNYVSAILNNQIMMISKELNLLFILNYI
ncbi:Conserved_hypothetical protein [Hexamita inflata]|uniref:Uncharacterized protein n=1 Tax=Hexamita inflata TaxID=28002 RepID=A0AA86PXZ8_9EUKA|nr:Conserved hypothetical protein [Hexamita inflata]